MQAVQHHLVVCSSAMWLVGIADALGHIPGLRVTCCAPQLLQTTDYLTSLAPDIILFERGAWDWQPSPLLLDVPMLEIDAAQNELLVRKVQRVTISDMKDLARFIQATLDF